MTASIRRCFLSASPLLLALLLLGVDSRPVAAEARCFERLRDCYGRAAGRDSWVDMWLAGADCELDFTDCVRRALIGR